MNTLTAAPERARRILNDMSPTRRRCRRGRLNVSDVATALELTPAHVRQLARTGALPGRLSRTGRWSFSIANLETYLGLRPRPVAVLSFTVPPRRLVR